MQIDPIEMRERSVAYPVSGAELMKYQIAVREHLDAKWAKWFSEMEIATCQESRALTVLTGFVADQAALHGILARIRDLNLTIVSVRWLDADSAERAKGE
jgi:hypothetical protein